MNCNLNVRVERVEGRCLREPQFVFLFGIPAHWNEPREKTASDETKGTRKWLTVARERVRPVVECRVEVGDDVLVPLLVGLPVLRSQFVG